MSQTTVKENSKVWLVTGCSSGFGRLFVPAILARGDRVIATARSAAGLVGIDTTEYSRTLLLDVTAGQEVIDQKVNEATNFFGRIDVLVNNAGYVASGVWEEVSHEETLEQFNTNVFGAINVTRGVLPQMRTRKSGTILFMSSISAWVGVGGGGLYSSSKFALEGAVECLQKETSHLNIETYLIVLGQFRTDILSAKNRKANNKRPLPEYVSISESMTDRHEQTNGKQPGNPNLAVQRVIDVVRREGAMEGIETPPLRLILGSDAVAVVRSKCMETLAMVEKYEQFSRSTDYEGAAQVPVYK